MAKKTKKVAHRKCNVCGKLGHNRRSHKPGSKLGRRIHPVGRKSRGGEGL